jgi:hypothetical protein
MLGRPKGRWNGPQPAQLSVARDKSRRGSSFEPDFALQAARFGRFDVLRARLGKPRRVKALAPDPALSLR